MKLERSNNGNLIIKNSSDEITTVIPLPKVFIVDESDDDYVFISDKTKLNSTEQVENVNLRIYVPDVSEINGVAFDGTTQEFLTEMDGVSQSTDKTFGDYISSDIDGDYEAFVDFGSRKNVLLVKTTTTGTAIDKRYYHTTVADTAAYDTLWANRATQTYVNLVDL